jgi:hypothetical protein
MINLAFAMGPLSRFTIDARTGIRAQRAHAGQDIQLRGIHRRIIRPRVLFNTLGNQFLPAPTFIAITRAPSLAMTLLSFTKNLLLQMLATMMANILTLLGCEFGVFERTLIP